MGETFKYLITVSGEMPIKSWRSRPRFYKTLVSNLSEALERRGSPKPKHSIRIINAKIVLESEVDALEDLSRVFGVARVAEVEVIDFSDLKELIGKVGELTTKLVTNKKFAVRVKRSGIHSFTSIDVAKELGAYLKPYSAGVDLENPDVEIILEVRGSKAYLYRRSIKGVGGLPIGTEGHALSLFSGGIDSPVAAWLTAKRGVKVDYLHFFMGSPKSTSLAFTVARTLTSMWFYGHRPKLYVIDLTEVLNQIREKVTWEFRQIVLRTLMYLISAEVA
ncbi:MAG: THUMP domain-containing protein, partial [Zestosphaera sp.]